MVFFEYTKDWWVTNVLIAESMSLLVLVKLTVGLIFFDEAHSFVQRNKYECVVLKFIIYRSCSGKFCCVVCSLGM